MSNIQPCKTNKRNVTGNLLEFFKRPIFYNPKLLLTIWTVVTLCAAGLKCSEGNYNNYLIFRGATHHMLAQEPLYTPPATPMDLDQYLYGPVFTVVVAPWAMLPAAVGMILWVVALAWLLWWAIRALPINAQAQAVIIWISANELFTALSMQQFNVAVAALIIGTFVMIEKDRPSLAAMMIVLGAMAKIYGIVGLAFFFFVRRKWLFVAYIFMWVGIFFVLPMFFSSPAYILGQYGEWFETLVHKNHINTFAELQNLSLLGLVRKVSGVATYSDLWLIVPGIILFGLAYLRVNQYKYIRYRLLILASVLLFIVLFSSGSENSTHVIAALGVGIWCIASPARWGWLQSVLLGMFVFMTFSRSIIGYDLDFKYTVAYSLKIIPFALVWFRICYELYFLDFSAKLSMRPVVAKGRPLARSK